MWIRCFDERERKLKNLTQKLGQKFVSKAEPKRTTKLAFVNTACKVPKNVARAQVRVLCRKLIGIRLFEIGIA